VLTEGGPVVHPEDAAGGKVGTLARLGQVRDYADTAALLGQWTRPSWRALPAAWTPPLPPHLAEIARRLDRLPDHAFAPDGLDIPGRTGGPPWSGNGSPHGPATLAPSAAASTGRPVRQPGSTGHRRNAPRRHAGPGPVTALAAAIPRN
jgi:hypothetical protein